MPIEEIISASAIARRVGELAAEIRRDAGPATPVHFVGVLKGAFVFLADLMRATAGPVTCDLLSVSSYGAGKTPSGEVRLTKDLDETLAGRDVMLVEDVIDTGLTLNYLHEIVRAREPRSLRTVSLLSKPAQRRIDVRIDYVGFEVSDDFVVGYGLDLDGRYRNLPFIARIR